VNEIVKKDWWLGVAALIAGIELVIAVGIWVDKLVADTTTINGVVTDLPGKALLVWGDILLTAVAVVAAAAILTGIYLRTRQPDRSRWLIVAGLIPAVLVGVVFFWFPPFWIVSGAAIAVIVRAGRGATNEPVPA